MNEMIKRQVYIREFSAKLVVILCELNNRSTMIDSRKPNDKIIKESAEHLSITHGIDINLVGDMWYIIVNYGIVCAYHVLARTQFKYPLLPTGLEFERLPVLIFIQIIYNINDEVCPYESIIIGLISTIIKSIDITPFKQFQQGAKSIMSIL